MLLIRHGSVDTLAVGNGVPCIYGPHEPLDTHGVHQSIRLAEQLSQQGIRPDLIVSSQYERAYQTANLIHEKFANHPPVIPDSFFNGAHTPQWDHRPETELARVDNNFFAGNPAIPDVHGETLPHVYNRVIAEYKRLLESHKTGTIAIVTHEEIIGIILHHIKHGDRVAPGIEHSIEKGEAMVLTYDKNNTLLDQHIVTSEGGTRRPEQNK